MIAALFGAGAAIAASAQAEATTIKALKDAVFGFCPLALADPGLLGNAEKLTALGFELSDQDTARSLAHPTLGVPATANAREAPITITIYPGTTTCNILIRSADARERLDGFEAVLAKSKGVHKTKRSPWTTGPVRFSAYEALAAKDLKIRVTFSTDADPTPSGFNLIQVNFPKD